MRVFLGPWPGIAALIRLPVEARAATSRSSRGAPRGSSPAQSRRRAGSLAAPTGMAEVVDAKRVARSRAAPPLPDLRSSRGSGRSTTGLPDLELFPERLGGGAAPPGGGPPAWSRTGLPRGQLRGGPLPRSPDGRLRRGRGPGRRSLLDGGRGRSWRDGPRDAAAREIFGPQRLVVRDTGGGEAGPGARAAAPSRHGLGGTGPRGDSSRRAPAFIADTSAGRKTEVLPGPAGQPGSASRAAYARETGASSTCSPTRGRSPSRRSRAEPRERRRRRLLGVRPRFSPARQRRANGFPAEDSDFHRADVWGRSATPGRRPGTLGRRRLRSARIREEARGPAGGRLVDTRTSTGSAMSLVAGGGGWLLTCSCSGLVGADLFQKIVFSASVEARASFEITERQGADTVGSLRSGWTVPEGEYLKGLWLSRLQ